MCTGSLLVQIDAAAFWGDRTFSNLRGPVHNGEREQHFWRRLCPQSTCCYGGITDRLCSSDHVAKATLASQQLS